MEYLLHEANIDLERIEEVKQIGNIDLPANACKIVIYVVQGEEQNVIEFGK